MTKKLIVIYMTMVFLFGLQCVTGSLTWAAAGGTTCSTLSELYYIKFQCCTSNHASCPGLLNASQRAGCPSLSCEVPAQFDPIINAYPNADVVPGLIAGMGWFYVLTWDVEPIDEVFLSVCAQVNNLDASAVDWIPDNYLLGAGPLPAVCVNISLWDQTLAFVSNLEYNPITDPTGLERDCGVSLGCYTGLCQEGFEFVPCCRMAVTCYDTQGGTFSIFAADYRF